MNWEAHKHFSLLACKGIINDEDVIEYSVYPDKREVWKECGNFKHVFYMSDSCPPPPPFHHSRVILEAIDYYLQRSRELYLKGDARYTRLLGYVMHYVGDYIIEPLDPIDFSVKWNYRPKMNEVDKVVLSIKEWSTMSNEVLFIPQDLVHVKLHDARVAVARGDYVKGVELALNVARRLCYSVVHGYKNARKVIPKLLRFLFPYDPLPWEPRE